jgi:hypothetical protein
MMRYSTGPSNLWPVWLPETTSIMFNALLCRIERKAWETAMQAALGQFYRTVPTVHNQRQAFVIAVRTDNVASPLKRDIRTLSQTRTY